MSAQTRETEVQYVLREQVESELNSSEAQGVISPVANCIWGSLLVLHTK